MQTQTLPIDFRHPEPNVGGIPLWLSPAPIQPHIVDALTEAYRRGRAQIDTAAYASFAFELQPAAHHRIICEALDALTHDLYDDLIINIPPGAAKSTYASLVFPTRYMGANPGHSVILATHTADLAEKWSRRVRNAITDPRHSQVFPDPASALSRDSTAVSRWATQAGGEFLATGVGAAILGFRADLALIDDPIGSFDEAQSSTILASLHAWYENDLLTRLKPNGKVVLICQRLAALDLAGYIIQRHRTSPTRRLKLLVMPMLSAPTPTQPDPLQRPPNSRLWPEWFTEQQVADAQRDPVKWRTLYQQEPPSDSGEWVSPDDIQYRSSPSLGDAGDAGSAGITIYGTIDLALTLNKGDETAIFIVAVHPDQSIDILHGDFSRTDPSTTAERVNALNITYKPQEWLVDDDNASKVFQRLLQPLPWHPMPIRGQNKEVRAAALRGLFKRRLVYLPDKSQSQSQPWVTKLVQQLFQFPNAVGTAVDDGVDSLSLIGRRLHTLAPAAPSVPSAPTPTTAQMTLEGLWDTLGTSPYLKRRIA